MAITDKKIGSWTNPVVNEADQPQRTAAEMKAIFDSNSNQIKTAFNAVVDELVGEGGAGNVGNGAFGEIPAGTVAAQLAALLNMLGSYPSSSDIKGIRLSADNKIEVTLDGTTWKPTAQTGDPVTDLGALPVAADIQDTDGFLMYDASEMKNKRTLWSKIKEAIGTVFAAGTVGDKYTISLEPDTADNAASIIRIKENATGNPRVLIAANTDVNTGEVSQIVLRDGTNVGKINIQCNTAGAKGIRITDGNNVERIKLLYTTTDDTCRFQINDASGNDVTLQTIGAQATRLTFTDLAVPVSAWEDDAYDQYADFPYQAQVACAGVTADMFAEVVLNPADAISGNYAPICVTGAGIVWLYAKAIPSAAITIRSIVAWR